MIIIEKRKISFFTIMFVLILGLTNSVYAENIEVDTLSTDSLVEQSSYNTIISDKIISLKENKVIANILSNSVSGIDFTNIGTSVATDTSYDLRDYYNIEVKDQGSTECCWAFSILSSAEINMQIKKGIEVDFSEKHMNYATSESFYDGTNENAFNRTASEGGSTIIGLAYLTNGQGAVLEEEMEFSDDTSNISLSEIDIDPTYYVTGYEMLPTIYKVKSNGETLYTDGYGTYYTDSEVDSLRQIIKEHIVEYGAVTSYTAASAIQYYNNTDTFSATAYYCDDMSIDVDHAVTIVGWDDTYSRYNFTGDAMPEKDGAYIVLNSYSDDYFDNGYIYISYEDVWIETMLYGITETSSIDYDNLYQHDSFGANVPITLADSSGNNMEEGYYASIYSRDSVDSEKLYQVAISTNQYAEFEIYVNPNGEDLSSENLILVATTEVLKPGYNTISFDGIELTGDKFAVVIKQKAIDEIYYFMIEAKIDGTFYENTTATAGDSKVSIDGVNWYNLADLGYVIYSGYIVDLSCADVCIKAFTTVGEENSDNETISSSVYSISSDNYITQIYDKTTINEFLNNVTFSSTEYSFIDKNGTTVIDYNSYVTTDMTLKIDNKIYYLAVRGDLNGDGKITLIDLSKHVLYYVEYDGYVLSGAYEKAADINFDGKFSLIDVSKLRVIFVDM